MELHQRTAAVIHLDRLAKNIETLRRRLAPGAEIMAVVKADAYGLGAEGILPTLLACGIRRFAVAFWEEGMALRQAGLEAPILLLGDVWDDQLPEILKWRLTPTIFSLETAEKLNALAAKTGIVHPIHIKLDTGMSRIGFPADDRALAPIEDIAGMKNLTIEGAFTHFPKADEPDGTTETQFGKFMSVIQALETRGIHIPFLHTANSLAAVRYPHMHLSAVRSGDLLFGLYSPEWEGPEAFPEVLTWHSHVSLVKTVPAGTAIGYGGTYVTDRETVLATIPVGFADGYSRRLSNRGAVILHGQEAPIRGRVCMDQFMVDVTDIPGVRRGDPVTLLGGAMTAQRMAEMLDVITDEITCPISRRVPRLYLAEPME